jgi:hypothetical protein
MWIMGNALEPKAYSQWLIDTKRRHFAESENENVARWNANTKVIIKLVESCVSLLLQMM